MMVGTFGRFGILPRVTRVVMERKGATTVILLCVFRWMGGGRDGYGELETDRVTGYLK